MFKRKKCKRIIKKAKIKTLASNEQLLRNNEQRVMSSEQKVM